MGSNASVLIEKARGRKVKIAKACGGEGDQEILLGSGSLVCETPVVGVASPADSCLVPHFCAFPAGDCRVISRHVMLRQGRCGEHLENPVGLPPP